MMAEGEELYRDLGVEFRPRWFPAFYALSKRSPLAVGELAAARLDALKKLEEKAADEGAKAALAWARAGIESEMAPYTPSAKELKQCVGIFGPREFFMEGSKLMYQREGRPKVTLVPMAKDLFGLDGVEYFRVRFARDASGAVDAVVGMYDNGREERNPKGK
jgi:hypothetical protein